MAVWELAREPKRCDKLFVFVTRRNVPPTNNVSERALRPSAICGEVRSRPWKWEQGANWNGAVSVVVDGDDDEGAETDNRRLPVFRGSREAALRRTGKQGLRMLS